MVKRLWECMWGWQCRVAKDVKVKVEVRKVG